MLLYDLIPSEYIGTNILEVGVGKQPILRSKLREKVLLGNYQGIDADPPTELFNVQKANILSYELKKKYDTIIMIEVLEHIHFRHWKDVIDKLKFNLEVGGYLILSTPFKERLCDFIYSYPRGFFQVHTVFGINKKVMRHFFPNCQIKIFYKILFRQDNCRLSWAIGRFMKRLIYGPFPIKRTIMIFWQKPL